MTITPKTKADIVAQVRALAELCLDVAAEADYFGGFDSEMNRVSRVLTYGAQSLVLLANEVDK